MSSGRARLSAVCGALARDRTRPGHPGPSPQTGAMREIGLGLLGLGTVGTGVVKILKTHGHALDERVGGRLELTRVADADLGRPREGVDVRSLPMVGDAYRVIADPAVDIVLELIGGLEPARTFILRALAAGKHVVTANKALLAHHGPELFEEARRRRLM